MPLIYLTSGTSWTVPADWDSYNNTIFCIGGGGAKTNQGANNGGGGGGGACSVLYNLTLTPSASVTYQVGAAGWYGNSSGAGGDTWFNGASFAAASCGARGGAAGTPTSGGGGGSAAYGIGDIKYNGGAGSVGELILSRYYYSGGGGGAAGPNGNGGNGTSQGLGGSADGGLTEGSPTGVAGLAGAEWPSYGCGSGGGGGLYDNVIGLVSNSASGGSYGGGAGGNCAWQTTYEQFGGAGLIVIQYYLPHPAAAQLLSL